MSTDTNDLFKLAIRKNASDIHLLAHTPPVLRVDGKLTIVDSLPFYTPEDINRVFEAITSDEQREVFQQEQELDFAHSYSGGIRFRANACLQNGNLSLVFRVIRNIIPSIEDLGLPPVCQELVTKPHGLVIVTGPTGSGKSTTLAAMIEYLNHHQHRRIVTVEDPIEYEYSSADCIITQREVGFDTRTFAAALRHVLRQDPDIILVGEIRDLETAAAVLSIAETGHLVLSTGHAPSAPLSIERIIDLFPPHQQSLAQGRLAGALNGVLCQQLVPKADGSGRVPAVEVMLATPAVKNLIRDGKTYQLPNIIRTGSQAGMCTMDEALASLYLKKVISKKEVFDRCGDEDELARIVGESRRGMSTQVPAAAMPTHT